MVFLCWTVSAVAKFGSAVLIRFLRGVFASKASRQSAVLALSFVTFSCVDPILDVLELESPGSRHLKARNISPKRQSINCFFVDG